MFILLVIKTPTCCGSPDYIKLTEAIYRKQPQDQH